MNNTKTQKITIKIKNYKSLENICFSISKHSKNLIAIIGENNVGKSSLMEVMVKLSENSRFLSKITNDSVEERTTFNDGTTLELNPSIELLFLFEGEDLGKKIEHALKTSINEKNHYLPISFEENYKKSIETQKNKLYEKLKKSELHPAYIMERTSWRLGTFEDEYKYQYFLKAIENKGDKSLIDSTKKLRKLYLKSIEAKKTKLTIKYFNEFNIFQFTDLDLNILTVDGYGLKEIQLKEREMIWKWGSILRIDFLEILKEREAIKDERKLNDFIDLKEKKFNDLIKKITKLFNINLKHEINIKFSPNNHLLINFKIVSTKEKLIWNNDPFTSGDGIKSFYSIIFLLHSVKKEEIAIILIDEPEKHLNPIYQNYLLTYIKKLSESPERKNQIIIYATHSPFMIDLDIYDNLFFMQRSKNNSSILSHIYNNKGLDVPNAILDKNIEIRFIESNLQKEKPKQIIFVEGITDFNVIQNIIDNNPEVFIIPLFGDEYQKTASFHIPYIQSYSDNYKVIVDNDDTGQRIISWFQAETNIKQENIKKYSDFSDNGNNLEDTIINPWFEKNKIYQKTTNKKINSLIFNKNNRDKYKNVYNFIFS